MAYGFSRPVVWTLGAIAVLALLPVFASRASAEDRVRHDFKRQQLTDVYYSEGANVGDLNRDGKMDIVHGPLWFEGPDFKIKHEIYRPRAQSREGYSDNFFSWVHDFNGDGWNDVLVVGFPGTPAYVYENPKDAAGKTQWPKHQIFDWVSNESPQFVDLTGDGKPELVCTRDGHFGYAEPNWDKGLETWTFHKLSEKVATPKFGHGLGIGDVDGDKRQDVLTQSGWFQQPESLKGDPMWKFHKFTFAPAGGAEMYAYDVDGDGDNDVITSLAAHEFGLAWFEQIKKDGQIGFKRHLIMGSKTDQNRYGVLFSELHSVNLADIDGDGLKDIVTGKTYWSHHRQSPMWDAGAVVYWFRLVRGKEGVDWVPYRADDEAGIGRQLVVADVNGDKLPDFVVGGMKGAHVLTHVRTAVSEEDWKKAQPKPIDGYKPEAARTSSISPDTGHAKGAIEGESLKVLKKTGTARPQDMTPFTAGEWSGGSQLFWSGAKPGDRLDLELTVAESGTYAIEAVLTRAKDYAIVQLSLDGEKLGDTIDLYNPQVVSTGVLKLGRRELKAGPHTLTIEITGANAAAVKSHMVGLDYIKIVPSRDQ